MSNKVKKKLLLIWHEAGNPLYFDRFHALSEFFQTTVFGFNKFKKASFPEVPKTTDFHMTLFKPLLAFHWLLVFSLPMLKRIRKEKYDIIYLHEEPHSLLAFFTCLLAKDSQIILDAAVINKRLNFKNLNIFENYVYKKIDIVFYRNDDVKSILIDRGCPEQKLAKRLGNGVSKRSFSPAPLENFSGSLSSFPTGKPYIVGYAGRIWKWKGVEVLLSIAKLDNVSVVACGPIWDEKLANRLRDAGVILLSELKKAELIKFYSSIDLFILPSIPSPNWTEQFGRVIVESVFCGTPAIGSDTGFIPNLVGPEATFRAGNVEEALGLVKKYSDNIVRSALFRSQKERLENEYSWEGIANSVYISTEEFMKPCAGLADEKL